MANHGEKSSRRASCSRASSSKKTSSTTGKSSSSSSSKTTSTIPSSWNSSSELDSIRQSFLDEINEIRVAHSLNKVTFNRLLNKCAALHNYDQAYIMNSKQHPGSDGARIGQRLRRIGYAYKWAGENLAHRQPTVERAVNSLMKSPGHRKIILSKTAEEMGIHGAAGADGFWFWTQILAAPQD